MQCDVTVYHKGRKNHGQHLCSKPAAYTGTSYAGSHAVCIQHATRLNMGSWSNIKKL